MGRFNNRVALVTGGGTGIGRAAAIAFGKEGAQVVIGNRNEKAGQAVVKEIEAGGGKAVFQRCDVTQEADVKALVAFTLSKFGKLDVAFNNSGVEGELGPVVEQTEKNYRQTFDVNVLGVMLCMKHEIPAIAKQGGAIVNNASIAASVGMAGGSVYFGSKHAVLGMTRCAALEAIQQKVRINAVSPAAIQTEMMERFTNHSDEAQAQFRSQHPIGRFGQPEEIAAAVLWLCSDEASFMVGHDLRVDGGFTVP